MQRHGTSLAAAPSLTLPEALSAAVAALVVVMETLNRELDGAHARLARHAAAEPVARRLETLPNIGPDTALRTRTHRRSRRFSPLGLGKLKDQGPPGRPKMRRRCAAGGRRWRFTNRPG